MARGFFVAVVVLTLLALPRNGQAQQVVVMTVPPAVGFSVTDVGQSTSGTPSATRASFLVVNLALFHVLRVSVKADSDFVPPGGAAIPASNVSWTTSNATGVNASGGTLSSAAYTQLFQMQNSLIGAGGVDIHWTLAPPGSGVRAGNHSLVVRWRLESVVP
jgi:hypothetical protein